MLACWLLSGAIVALSVGFSVWSARRGLGAPGAGAPASPRRRGADRARFGRDPLYRKELLWFARDRGALVQALLVPLTMAGLQLFNMRGALEAARDQWNVFCGAAILFGTYFLSVLGPKSLASEGAALWIALTWPRGLESLLKAKARLWTLLSSCIVALVLGAAAWRFPGDLWSVALVGCGWMLFARSMADKAVTLATVAEASGEAGKIPNGRRWAVQLGTLPFAVGVFTRHWEVAVAGIVYSTASAAAMWESFRARLPYLYDPWSERLPPPPTLMHAMIAIAALVEGGALLIGAGQALAAYGGAAAARPWCRRSPMASPRPASGPAPPASSASAAWHSPTPGAGSRRMPRDSARSRRPYSPAACSARPWACWAVATSRRSTSRPASRRCWTRRGRGWTPRRTCMRPTSPWPS